MGRGPRVVRLELGDLGRDVVTVLEELDLDRYLIEFKSGARLIVPRSVTTDITTREKHGRQHRHPAPAELELG